MVQRSSNDRRVVYPRRRFLRSGGAALLAGAAGLMGAAGLAGCAASQNGILEKEAGRLPDGPWPYHLLDTELIRKRGHAGYYQGECCYGAFSAMVDSLVEVVGFPFTQMPTQMMAFGGGGVAGWGTICGALLGASAAINLVAPKEDARIIVNELLGWYTQAQFPTEASNRYAVQHEFLVEEYKSDQVLPQSISHSPLCHVSVSRWCTSSGMASGSSERSERCGRLTGDVAAWTARMLNDYHMGRLHASYQLSPATQTCTTCHHKGKEFEEGHFTAGQMECTQCHEPHGK